MRNHLLVVACGCALGACAFSLSGGAALTQRNRPSPTTSISLTTHAFRRASTVFGLRLTTAYHHGFAIRHAMLHTGYEAKLVPGCLAFEPAIELGVGRPAATSLSGTGSYAGVAANLRVHVLGVDESEPAFNVYAVTGDIVLGTRLGGWMPPEAANNHQLIWEWSFEAGVRFAIGSDIVTSAQGEIADTASAAEDDASLEDAGVEREPATPDGDSASSNEGNP